MKPESAWQVFSELDESICSAAAGRHMAAREESSNIGVLVEKSIVTRPAAKVLRRG